MILYPDNEIDNCLTATFSKEKLDELDKDCLDLIGINISTDASENMDFKIYYQNDYSIEEYKKNEKIPFVEYILKRDLSQFFNIVHDKSNSKASRFALRLKKRDDASIFKLFQYLEKKVDFFNQYKNEILHLSTMRNRLNKEGYKYRALFILGGVYEEESLKLLKFYWGNNIEEDDNTQNNQYYLHFLEQSNIEGFKRIVPLTKKVLKNCSGNLAFEGVDYSKDKAKKHKIYISYIKDLYNGLAKIFPDNEEFIKKLKTIEEWHKLHEELYCDFLAVGKDDKGNNIFNFYFSMKKGNYSFSLKKND